METFQNDQNSDYDEKIEIYKEIRKTTNWLTEYEIPVIIAKIAEDIDPINEKGESVDIFKEAKKILLAQYKISNYEITRTFNHYKIGSKVLLPASENNDYEKWKLNELNIQDEI